jgi:hypothetical protein
VGGHGTRDLWHQLFDERQKDADDPTERACRVKARSGVRRGDLPLQPETGAHERGPIRTHLGSLASLAKLGVAEHELVIAKRNRELG